MRFRSFLGVKTMESKVDVSLKYQKAIMVLTFKISASKCLNVLLC